MVEWHNPSLGRGWSRFLKGDPARVLLVEDDVEVAQAITRQLRQRGFEVVATPSGATATALTCCFEVGVFDIELSDGDGVQLATLMLEDAQVLHVVFFSNASFPPSLARAERLGPVVRKAEGIEALIPVVTGVTERRSPTVSAVVPAGHDDAGAQEPGRKRARDAG
jgi:DNA-binding response OmpR family regulator